MSTRAERLMNRLGNVANISPEGLEWLKVVLDPFHDFETHCRGYPDNNISSSVVECIKQSVTLAVPNGISGNWDCSIVHWPWASNIDTSDAVQEAGSQVSMQKVTQQFPSNFIESSINHSGFGGVTMQAVASGGTFPLSSLVDQQITLPAAYTTGAFRVIGTAFEVYNTTSDLNVQGSVTVWRNPVPTPQQPTLITWTGNDSNGHNIVQNIPAIPISGPPETTAAALLLTGTREWKAKDGCYMVSTMNSTQNPVINANYNQPLIRTSTDVDASEYYLTYYPEFYTATNNIGQMYFMALPQLPWTPFNMQGAIFTGLSNTTTLRLDVNYYVEVFPDPSQKQLCVLATPSPTYCPNALEAYGHAIRNMPVGVPVAENGLGDWFADIVDAADTWVSPVLSMLPGPLAQGANTLIKGAKSLMGRAKGKEGQDLKVAFKKQFPGKGGNTPAITQQGGNKGTKRPKGGGGGSRMKPKGAFGPLRRNGRY